MSKHLLNYVLHQHFIAYIEIGEKIYKLARFEYNYIKNGRNTVI